MICLNHPGQTVLSFPQMLLTPASPSSKSWQWNGGGFLRSYLVVCPDWRSWQLHESQIQSHVAFFRVSATTSKKSPMLIYEVIMAQEGMTKNANEQWVLRRNFFSQANMVGTNKKYEFIASSGGISSCPPETIWLESNKIYHIKVCGPMTEISNSTYARHHWAGSQIVLCNCESRRLLFPSIRSTLVCKSYKSLKWWLVGHISAFCYNIIYLYMGGSTLLVV